MELYKTIWDDLLQEISSSNEISTIAYDMWFSNLKPYSISNEKIILLTNLKSTKDILNKDYKIKINNCIKKLNNPLVKDYYIITEEEKLSYTQDVEEIIKDEEFIDTTPMFNDFYTFNNFVVGNSNSFAYNASKNVAQNPGISFNPLFIYGGVGLGKTHLLHAVGNDILSKNPNTNIIYITTEQFTNDFIESINNKSDSTKNFEFRYKYRNADILMLDDIQFLAGKTTTQEALFHTFNDLIGLKKQIILTSDRHPKELTFLNDRLKSRFQAGLTVEINKPDIETRIAIIRKKSLQKNFIIDNDIILYIAENIDSNIREIEGAISKLIFYCQLNGKDKADNILLAKEALKNEISTSSHILTMDTITDAVCSYFNISKSDIKSNKRPKNIAIPRQIAIYLILDMLDSTTTAVGKYFGGKDHTTISYARDKINEEMKTNNLISLQIKDIKNIIQQN